MLDILHTKIENLRGIGPRKVDVLNKELRIFTFKHMLYYFPFRYEDRSRIYQINQIHADLPYIQIKGKFRNFELLGEGKKKRLKATLEDGTGSIEVVWFRGIKWVQQKLAVGMPYLVFGKGQFYGSKVSISHPEVEEIGNSNNISNATSTLLPVYPSSDRLKNSLLDNKMIRKFQKMILDYCENSISETLPLKLREHFSLLTKSEALSHIHFPKSEQWLSAAKQRLKFEELFYLQLRLLKTKIDRQQNHKGFIFNNTSLVSEFYKNHLPFELTNAQKKIVKEVFSDMKTGNQMNRLVQGDVGSGKTMVAFICMLIAIGNNTQAAIMAPTEILARQHYEGLKEYTDKLGLTISLLTGSVTKKNRREIHENLANGNLNILVGTHALLEDEVKFHTLGLAVVDEQHRFGVAQRSRLWTKNTNGIFPHILVMTATPIPRTLAMTLYGDLDLSVIDEMPAGRKAIKTMHMHDAHRLKINAFIKKEVEIGRQIYIVYPLIEENEKLGLKDLMDGYESASRSFPDYPLSIVHGKMKSETKNYEMQRFIKGETKIMVATTVIEVGVNVPNASVMIIENAERFGLAQLHQLRGRVGRGAEQSFCILVSKEKLSKESKIRMETMVRTNDGFDIAETDLKLRGAGDITGTMQSGVLDLGIADIATDGKILQAARKSAKHILESDQTLESEEHQMIKLELEKQQNSSLNWGRIS